MDRIRFRFVEPVEGDLYAALLDCAAERAARFGIVLLPGVSYSRGALEFLDLIDGSSSARRRASVWPGTVQTNGPPAEVREYRISRDTIRALREVAGGLSEWCGPRLPDFPHFLREGGSTWLASIPDEQEVWLELSSQEFDALIQGHPSVARALARAGTKHALLGALVGIWILDDGSPLPDDTREFEVVVREVGMSELRGDLDEPQAYASDGMTLRLILEEASLGSLVEGGEALGLLEKSGGGDPLGHPTWRVRAQLM